MSICKWNHTSVWQKHTHTHTQRPHASSLCWIVASPPFCPSSRLILTGMILHFITWLFEPRPHHLYAKTMWKKGKKKKSHQSTSLGRHGGSGGGEVGHSLLTYYISWKLGHSGRGGTSLRWNADTVPSCTREGIKTAHGSRLPPPTHFYPPDLTGLEGRSHSLV